MDSSFCGRAAWGKAIADTYSPLLFYSCSDGRDADSVCISRLEPGWDTVSSA